MRTICPPYQHRTTTQAIDVAHGDCFTWNNPRSARKVLPRNDRRAVMCVTRRTCATWTICPPYRHRTTTQATSGAWALFHVKQSRFARKVLPRNDRRAVMCARRTCATPMISRPYRHRATDGRLAGCA